MPLQKHQKKALLRAQAEVAIYGCTVHHSLEKPFDRHGHAVLVVTDPSTGRTETVGVSSSPKNRDASIEHTGRMARHAARRLTGRR